MTHAEHRAIWPHEDEALFSEAVRYTAAETGFAGRLVEKDYFASLVLAHLAQQDEPPLVFKGGTCLAKVHADFFRLSEDLDFAIAMDASSTRKQRRDSAKDLKGLLEELAKRMSSLSVLKPLRGANESRQYVGALGFESLLTREIQSTKFEVSQREPAAGAAAGGLRCLRAGPRHRAGHSRGQCRGVISGVGSSTLLSSIGRGTHEKSWVPFFFGTKEF